MPCFLKRKSFSQANWSTAEWSAVYRWNVLFLAGWIIFFTSSILIQARPDHISAQIGMLVLGLTGVFIQAANLREIGKTLSGRRNGFSLAMHSSDRDTLTDK
jgi:hypothetical protein